MFFTYACVNITTHKIGIDDSYWKILVYNRQHCLCDVYFRTWLSVQSVFIFIIFFFFTFSHIIDWMYWNRSGPKILGCLSVCLSMCVPVCLSALVWRNYRTNLKENFPKLVLYMSSCARLCFSSLALLMTSRSPSFPKKTRALSRSQFWSDFLEICDLSSITHHEVWNC